jgi:hypothetical protein
MRTLFALLQLVTGRRSAARFADFEAGEYQAPWLPSPYMYTPRRLLRGVQMSADTQPVTASRPSGKERRRRPTSKVTTATLAAAIASIAFILLGKFAPSAFTDTQLATLQGSVTTVLAFVLGYLIK